MARIVLDEPLAAELKEVAKQSDMTVEAWISEAVKRARWEAQRNKIRDESEWWFAQPLKTRQSFSKFVAVHQREVVDTDDDEQTLINRVRRKYGKTAVLITPIEERSEVRVVNYRFESV
ncbi:MAG: hypothetical protein HUU38_06970 [Anaerolineales bacterium]|nr:hypothetical protein [Anaerolineales bacterium]